MGILVRRGRLSIVAMAAVLVSVSGAGCARDASYYVQSGKQYAAQKKWNEAILEYRNAVRKEPRFGDARLALSEAYLQIGDPEGALRESARAADLLPGRVDAQLKAGGLLLSVRRFEDAKTRAQKALALDARNVEAQVLLANAIAGLKDIDGAISKIEEAVRLEPGLSSTYMSLAALQAVKGSTVEAEATYRRAIELDPKSMMARLALGYFFWTQGKAADAERLFLEGRALDPRDVLANRAVATFYLTSNRWAEAEPYLQAVVETTGAPEAKLLFADYYILSGRGEDALKILEPMAGAAGFSNEAGIRIAGIQYAAGQSMAAHKTIDAVLARDPASFGGLVAKGRFLLAEGKTDDAIARLREAVSVDPRSVAAQALLANAYVAKGERDAAVGTLARVIKLDPSSVASMLQMAQLQLDMGAADAAVDFALQAVRTDPGSVRARVLLIHALMARGDPAEAWTEASALIAKYPGVAQVNIEAGLVLLRAGRDLPAARRYFERALAIDPASPDALTGLVAIDLMERRGRAARARVDAALVKRPSDAALLVVAAEVSRVSGDSARCEQLLLQAIDVNPSRVEAYARLAQLYVAERRTDQALAKIEDLLKRQPSSVQALTMTGIVLQVQNRTAEARQRYERALALDPRSPVAANNLAWILADSGESLEVALQLAMTARAQSPHWPEVNDTLGWIYYKKGLWPQAIAAFEQAVAKAPNNAAFRYRLGMAYLQAKQVESARASLRRALALDPAFEQAEDTRRALASLR